MDLTHTATVAKRVIVISIILFVLAITAFASYRFYKSYQEAHRPPKEETIDRKFGDLPTPDFPQTKVSSSNFTYALDTKTGGLPNFGHTIRVYFMPKAFATLLAAEKSADLAAKFGIKQDPQVLTETKYLFADGDKNITIDLDTNNFFYKEDLLDEPDDDPLGEDNKLSQEFKLFLSSRGLVKKTLEEGSTKVELLKIEGDQVSPASSRSEANAAQISLWPEDLDKKPILTDNPNKSLINAIVVSNAGKLQNYKSLSYTFWPIDPTTFAVYPVKSAEQAFEDLKSGNSIILKSPEGGSSSISISSVYLAYFEESTYTPYLQPIVVFEGENFIAYVPAISTSPLTTP